MSSKTVLSTDEIPDIDVMSLYYSIAWSKHAYMIYSYTLNAGQILEKVRKAMSYIIATSSDAFRFECSIEDEKICVYGDYVWWDYKLIESAEYNFAAVIFHIILRGSNEMGHLSENAFIGIIAGIGMHLDMKLALEECAIDKIEIPQKSKAFEDNGFSFSRSELADAFRKSVFLKPPYRTTLSGGQTKVPTWYMAGRTAKGTYPVSVQPSNSSGGCYIATAVYGSYDCPEVWTLRRFRDSYLSKSLYGRLFIIMYYATSPMLVKCFGEAGWFKQFWKNRLDKWVISLNNKGYSDKSYHD